MPGSTPVSSYYSTEQALPTHTTSALEILNSMCPTVLCLAMESTSQSARTLPSSMVKTSLCAESSLVVSTRIQERISLYSNRFVYIISENFFITNVIASSHFHLGLRQPWNWLDVQQWPWVQCICHSHTRPNSPLLCHQNRALWRQDRVWKTSTAADCHQPISINFRHAISRTRSCDWNAWSCSGLGNQQ